VPAPGEWVLLAYRVPREPSAPRLAVWRKLKRLGVAQLVDGLVALPLDSRNREQLEWVADEVVAAGGDASIWTAQPETLAQERDLATAMQEAVAAQYRAVIEEARGLTAPADKRTLARLRRELNRINRRDYFSAPERDDARAAVEDLTTVAPKEHSG
jgi:DNA-binding transcriptional regulator PaaX